MFALKFEKFYIPKVVTASFFTYEDGLRFNTNNFVYETSSPALNNLKIMKDIKELMNKINNSGNVLKSTKCTFFIDLVLAIPIIVVWNLPIDTFGEKEQTNIGIQVLVSIILGYWYWFLHAAIHIVV